MTIEIDRFELQKSCLDSWIAQGAPENAAVVSGLLEELAEGGLKFTLPRRYVVDGSKPSDAILDNAGEQPSFTLPDHKIQNVCEHLPESQRHAVKCRMRCAYETTEAADGNQAFGKIKW